MTSSDATILILGGTGKTGRRISRRLRSAGAAVRTAARSGADTGFDWADDGTWAPALQGATAVYLVPPGATLDVASPLPAFLDAAEISGVRHITQLSARGVEHAPPQAPMRAAELDLRSRSGLTTTTLRPGWFLHNFSEYLFLPAIVDDDVIAAPTGSGAEAFVHADDIAAVAAATLLHPEAHAGAEYTLTGPTAHTFGEVAEAIGTAEGRPIRHLDEPREAWVRRITAQGLPADYASMLGGLLDEHVRAGHGAAATDDVERVIGRPPKGLTDYVAEAARTGVWARPSR